MKYIDFKDNDNPYIKTIRTNLPDYDFVLVNCKDSHSSLTHLYKKIQTDMFTLASHFGKKESYSILWQMIIGKLLTGLFGH